jgi:hyaluronoglucosaminidase
MAMLVAAPAGAGARRPRMSGVIEGYYGRPWEFGARRTVIRFLGHQGLDTFAYAPKNDEFHRLRWREPYPPAVLRQLERTVGVSRRAGVRFVYGLSPGLDICYSCEGDRRSLYAKLRQLARAGVGDFALLLDDTPPTLSHPRDVATHGGADATALARAQAALANRTARWLRRGGVGRLAFLVPTLYSGTECTPYHRTLAAALARGIPVAWTGSGVFSPTIATREVRAQERCVGRPVVLWDNFPVNDTVLANNLHLGPLTGREGGVPGALAGYLLNPMTQAHASLVPLATAAAFLRQPRTYDPERAWRRALADVGGASSLAVLAEQTRSSALDLDDARALAGIVDRIEATYEGADWLPALEALEAEEAGQAAAAANLPAELAGTALGREIAPWVAELGHHAARGLDAAALLRAMKPAPVRVAVSDSPGVVAVEGVVRGPDAELAVALGESFATEAGVVAARVARPDVAGYVACLGDFLGPTIRFCSEFGLNVHGKALFFFIGGPMSIEIVSDRNVHDRLVLLTARRYESWRSRRGPGADALRIRIEEMRVAPSRDGGFAARIARGGAGAIRVVVSTGAGESTAVAVAPGGAARFRVREALSTRRADSGSPRAHVTSPCK